MIDVTKAPFNAPNDGSADASAAIQSAINFASTLQVNQFAQYKATVFFPAGYYLINSTINLTNRGGIWLVGDGGPYLNTIILGNTGSRPMFDFSGSSQSGLENFTFLPSSASSPSTVGVQFALTSAGGLNCGIRKCYFQMTDVAGANGGLGSIGLLNVRSEEFYIHECLIRANSPLVMSNTVNIVVPGANYTATSSFQTLTPGAGTMGVTNINGTSFQTLEKRQPAMILIGTNSLNFHGYLGRLSATAGSNETAILCVSFTTNNKFHATVESFSRMLQVRDTGFGSCELDLISANATAPTTDLIDVTNSLVVGLRARISLAVVAERSNRYVLYHDGGQPATGSLANCEVSCFDIAGNQLIISPNLLKKSTNVVFQTGRPFEKKGGRLRQLTNNVVTIGTAGSITAATAVTVFQFQQAVQTLSGGTNAGYYRVLIEGIIKAGGAGSGALATLSFQAQLVVNQRGDGSFDQPSVTVIILDESTSNPAYLNIVGVLANITFANGLGTVTITPRITGSGTGEPVNYDGMAELQSDFLINDPIPL